MKTLRIINTSLKNQHGVVSLIVVAILAIVLGLIAVGFAQITNRELQQASDRELSAQAYYAAESGLNDAIAYLKAGGTSFTGCTNWPNSPINGGDYFKPTLTSTAKYSCVSVQTLVPYLQQSLGTGQSFTFKMDKNSVANMQRLYFGWANSTEQKTNNGSPLGTTGQLPQESDPSKFGPGMNTTGLLKVDIYAVPNGLTSATNDDLAKLSREYFMYPNSGGGGGSAGSVGFGSNLYNPSTGPSGSNGQFVPGNCKNGNTVNPVPSNPQAPLMYCNTFVSGLDSNSNIYYVRITALYAPLIVTLQAQSGSPGPLKFDGVQGNIDVTGQGTDVLQRIDTQVSLSNSYQSPDFAIQSMKTICKGFTVEVTGPGVYGTNSTANTLPDTDSACATPVSSGGSGTSNPVELGPH